MECINPYTNRWSIRFDLQENPADADGRAQGISYLEQTFDHEPTLDEVKAAVAAGIDQYDGSEAVNSFTVDGMAMWLDKQTRTSLSYTLSVVEGDVTTLWYEGLPPVAFELPAGQLKQMLAALEQYAKATYDVTQSHKAAIYALDSATDILLYDIRAGYPERLAFKTKAEE